MAVNARQKGQGLKDNLPHLRNTDTEPEEVSEYCGANGDADVVGISGNTYRSKNIKKCTCMTGWSKRRDSRQDELPAVFTRKQCRHSGDNDT